MPTPYGILGALALPLAAILAFVIFKVAPHAALNRRLALAILLEGALVGFAGGMAYLTTDPGMAAAFRRTAAVIAIISAPAYLLFLARLRTPLTRPLRTRTAEGLLVAYVVTGLIIHFAAQDLLLITYTRYPNGSWEASWAGIEAMWLFAAVAATYLFGFIAALSMYRRTRRGTVDRARARIYLVAFGVRDTIVGLTLAYWVFVALGSGRLPFEELRLDIWVSNAAVVFFLFILSYGILKHHLFDIDLKIKFALSRGTVAATFVAVFFAVSETAALLFSGSATTRAVFGIIGAALLVFFLAPLQRLADRLADRALPSVQATPEYVAFRKLEVYKAALEGAFQDDEVTAKERATLARLQAKLGISPSDAAALERDVQGTKIKSVDRRDVAQHRFSAPR
ncbi:MAG TPA: hypothetical protein VGB18_09670 [Candidatus Thermoplasmatota archaeon]